MRKHLNIKVFGRVQGVGFRYSAKDWAEKMNLTGCAKNEDDGSVYIEVEGEEDDLQKFIELCKKGSLLSGVEKVEFQKAPFKNFTEFKII